jgi:hypothetical protein
MEKKVCLKLVIFQNHTKMNGPKNIKEKKSVVSKNAVPSVLYLVEGIGKYQLDPGQQNMGNALVLSHCSLLRHP